MHSGPSVTDEELQTDFVEGPVLQSGKGRGESSKVFHTGEVPELGRPSCACCWGRGWGLHWRAEGVT